MVHCELLAKGTHEVDMNIEQPSDFIMHELLVLDDNMVLSSPPKEL